MKEYTLADVKRELAQEEALKDDGADFEESPSAFLIRGLELEDAQ
jgi:hypothetical protein